MLYEVLLLSCKLEWVMKERGKEGQAVVFDRNIFPFRPILWQKMAKTSLTLFMAKIRSNTSRQASSA